MSVAFGLRAIRLVTGAVLFAVLLACGGGETGTGAKTKTTSGTIDGFGSIYVNGIKFNTDSADITSDNVAINESQLAVGMYVTIVGEVDETNTTGKALSVVYEVEVNGLLLANNYNSNGELNVMGQTIKINNDTELDFASSGILSVDLIPLQTVLEVSGYSSGDGVVYATFLRIKDEADELKLRGVISNYNGVDTFNIGMLEVIFNGDTEFSGLKQSELANGMRVKVKSEDATLNGLGQLVADKIEKLEDEEHEEGEEVEFEGVVTQELNANNEFQLSGQTVRLGNNVEFEHGNISNIVLEAKLTVEGSIDGNGVIIAEEIEFEVESQLELEGTIDSIDLTSKKISVLGQPIYVGSTTSFEDKREGETARIGELSDLTIGNRVELKLFYDNDMKSLVASEVDVVDAKEDENAILNIDGRLESVNGDEFTVEHIDLIFDQSGIEDGSKVFDSDVPDEVEIKGMIDSNNEVFTVIELSFDD